MRASTNRGAARIPRTATGGAVGFRELLERLGPTYVKIGQFLALRPDLLPRDYSEELIGLLDRVPAFPWSAAREVITEDLGASPEELFEYINPRPVAAASMAQTHVARLRDGTEVAVKVQRPGLREQVRRDLRRARVVARALDATGVSLVVSPKDLIEELGWWIVEELDMHHELRNMTRLYELTGDSPYERIPRPYPSLSGGRVLTSEYLRGIPLSVLLAHVRSGRPEDAERVDRLGIDLDALAEALISAVFRQVFRYQFFHADVHPGNILALPGGRIGFLDFGLCDYLDENVRQGQLQYLAAAYSGSVDEMFDALLDILVPGEDTDITAFRRAFTAETRTWMSRMRIAGAVAAVNSGLDERAPGAEWDQDRGPADYGARDEDMKSPLGQWMVATMRTVRRHGLQLPPRVLSMYRTLLTAETVATQLGADADLRSVGRNFFTRLRVEEEIRALGPEQWQSSAASMLSLLRDSPRQLHRILSDLSEGRLVLTMNVSESFGMARAHKRRTRLLSTSIITVSVALLLTAADLPNVFGVSVAWPLGIWLAGMYASTIVLWLRLK